MGPGALGPATEGRPVLQPRRVSAAIAASSVHGARRIRTLSSNPDTSVLRDLAGYVTSGGLWPVIDSVYPLADIASAHQAFERGGVVGKQVVAVREAGDRR
ncbi:zinc-binding dehydrogenase [Streptomyces sp. NPDC015125]|uniref:zinc-binding dehydrogenase n=1 Tax=Streptomyces sp. NPDC015125 TaxID=3364938 RepID=UPI00370259C4